VRSRCRSAGPVPDAGVEHRGDGVGEREHERQLRAEHAVHLTQQARQVVHWSSVWIASTRSIDALVDEPEVGQLRLVALDADLAASAVERRVLMCSPDGSIAITFARRARGDGVRRRARIDGPRGVPSSMTRLPWTSPHSRTRRRPRHLDRTRRCSCRQCAACSRADGDFSVAWSTMSGSMLLVALVAARVALWWLHQWRAARCCRGIVDHRLARRHLINEYRRGRLRIDQVATRTRS